MLFGYDADIAPQLGTNLIRIRGIAESFLSSLVNKRQEDYVSIWIAVNYNPPEKRELIQAY